MLENQNIQTQQNKRLAEIYKPIRNELALVQNRLNEILSDNTKGLDELCEYVAHYKGKLLRPALLLISGAVCGNITNSHIEFAVILELIHLTTLIHDDVIDEADMRRNRRVLNHLWGNQASVLFGDFLLSKAFDLCNATEDIDSARKISKTTEIICKGEITQTLRKNDWKMAESEYMQIIDRKTASLYKLCCNLGASLSHAKNTEILLLENYGRYLGLAFQIADDLLDINSNNSIIGKDTGRDLSQGKATLPVIHFLETANKSDIETFFALVEHAKDNLDKIRSLLESNKSILYTRNKIDELTILANKQITNFPDCQPKQSLIQMSDFVARRL